MEEIKMRLTRDTKAVCEICGTSLDKSLEIYDLMIPNVLTGERRIFTFCDLCNEKIFSKLLKATVNLQGKTKSQKDIAIINSRHRMRYEKHYPNEAVSITEALKDTREEEDDGD